MNILITSCSRDVTLVKTFRRALINNGGGKVIAADINPMAPALYFADEHLIVPASDSETFIPFLIKFCREKRVKLLISSRDAELPVLSEAKEAFAAVGCRVMAANPGTIKTCQNKLLFGKFCEDNDIPSLKIYREEKNLKFPVFVKPVFGAGSKNSYKINNHHEYQFIKEYMKEAFLVQEFLDWPEYTIDLFADFDGQILSVIPRERIQTVAGESYAGRTLNNKRLINSALHLAEKLGLTGHNTLQCFFDGKVVKYIEVNPRFGGGANLGFHSGANTPEMLVKLCLGETLQPQIGTFEDDLVMLRYTRDAFFKIRHRGNKKNELISERSTAANRIICIDVDGTICTEHVEYEKAQPIEKTIKKINELYDRGNTIILYTARGAYSGTDWSELTESQLRAWGVKYHRFMIGKPFANEYVDNKAVDILDWF